MTTLLLSARMNSLLFVLAAPLLTAASAAPPLPPAEIDGLFTDRAGKPGCAVAIVEEGRLAFTKGYGLADLAVKRPITADAPFNIASMTKQFTGMAVALLIADGKLSEDDDVRRHLPELRDYGTPIRVANLLNHSSGLRNHMALAAFQPGDHLPSHEEALRLVFRQSALNFQPGTRHQYESPNYVLLAEIVSRVSRMTFDRFVETRILRPLGMSDSGFASPVLARSYAPTTEGDFEQRDKVNTARGSSGLLVSAREFASWMANYDRQSVGGRQAIGRMMSTSKLVDGTAISYRYGLIKEFGYRGVAGLTRVSHGGQTAAYRSAFFFFPGRGFGSVVMCNTHVDARAKLQVIEDAWLKGQASALAAKAQPAPTPLPAGLADRLAGNYYSPTDDDVRQFVVRNGALHLAIFGQEFPVEYRGDNRFAFFDQGEFRFARQPGDATSMTEVISEQATLRFSKLPPFDPRPLSDFIGHYRSSDVDGLVTIKTKGETLLLRYPAGEAELTAISPDRFSGQAFDFNHVAFRRDATGRVYGLTLTVNSGITRLRFERLAD